MESKCGCTPKFLGACFFCVSAENDRLREALTAIKDRGCHCAYWGSCGCGARMIEIAEEALCPSS